VGAPVPAAPVARPRPLSRVTTEPCRTGWLQLGCSCGGDVVCNTNIEEEISTLRALVHVVGFGIPLSATKAWIFYREYGSWVSTWS